MKTKQLQIQHKIYFRLKDFSEIAAKVNTKSHLFNKTKKKNVDNFQKMFLAKMLVALSV
jgi:hypothetical protein